MLGLIRSLVDDPGEQRRDHRRRRFVQKTGSIRLSLDEGFVFEAIMYRCKKAFVLGDTFLVNDLQECLADVERGRVLAGKSVELRRLGGGEFRVRDEVLEHQLHQMQMDLEPSQTGTVKLERTAGWLAFSIPPMGPRCCSMSRLDVSLR